MDNITSPLDGLLKLGHHGNIASVDSQNTLQISHRTCNSLFQITAWTKTDKFVVSALGKIAKLKLPSGNTSPDNDNFTIMPIGPGKYLIESDNSGAAGQYAKKIPPAKGAIIDLSHARVVIRISGNQAVWVLAKGIAIDFSLDAFPLQTSRNTSHHDIGLTIRRVDENTFDLFVFTSLARSFWHWLDIAAKEVGYEIVQASK